MVFEEFEKGCEVTLIYKSGATTTFNCSFSATDFMMLWKSGKKICIQEDADGTSYFYIVKPDVDFMSVKSL